MIVHYDRIMACAFSAAQPGFRKLHAELLHHGGIFRCKIAERVHAADGFQLLQHSMCKLLTAAQKGFTVVFSVKKALAVIECGFLIDAPKKIHTFLQIRVLLLDDHLLQIGGDLTAQLA